MSDELDDGIEMRLDQALLEFMRRFDAGNPDDRESFLGEHPELAPQLRVLLEAADWIESMAGPTLNEVAQSTHSANSQQDKGEYASSAPSFYSMSPDDSTLPPSRGSSEDASSLTLSNASNAGALLPCRFGEYMLECIIGRGGMGVVYLAYQVQLHRRVAIKMIRSGCLASQDEVERFYAEARSAASLDHPNIVTVYQCGECDSHHFFSMDYVPGTDLAKILANGRLPPREAARYVRDIAQAVDYAHQQGVVHRDLKPANVLIDESDQVVLTDFGLAKRIGAEQGLTATGAALGTPSYMSPEQASGRSEDQSASTDVYATGAILFALLTGKPPFHGDSVVQTIMQVIHRPAPTVRQFDASIDPDLDTIVAKCLEKSPARRYASSADLAEDLDRFLNGMPIHARPPSIVRRAKHWTANIPIVAALMGIKNVEPSRSQRMAQNIFLVSIFGIALTFFWGRYLIEYYGDVTLPSRIAIASGYKGGMYHEFAEHFATCLQQQTGLTPEVRETSGSFDNLRLLLQSQSQIGLMQESANRSEQIAVIAPLFYEAVHVLVKENSGIERIEQLVGKRVNMGLRESGTRQAALRLLKHFEVDETNMQEIDGDWTKPTTQEQVDALIVVIKVGQARMMELLQSGKFRLLSIDSSATMKIALEAPMFHQYDIEQSLYPNLANGTTRTLAVRALLVTKRNAPSRLVESCLQALYSQPEMARQLIPKRIAANWHELPYHNAAKRYYALGE